MSEEIRKLGGVLALMVAGAGIAGALLYFLLQASEPTALDDPDAEARLEKATTAGTLPAEALDPRAVPKAVFDIHHTLDFDGGQLVTGVVRNVSLTFTDRPAVTIICKDDKGAELGRATADAEREVLLPNGTSPAKVALPGLTRCPAPSAEVAVNKPESVAVYARDLVVETDAPSRGADGSWEITGRVRNSGDRSARYVQVQIQAWDISGRLVGVDSVFTKGDLLMVGGEARFHVTGLRYGKEPSKFEFSAFGRSAS